MPVSLLLCEGGNNSPDARLLGKLLAGLCEIRPMGGKYGMGERIKARREVIGENAVFGLLDGDFQENWEQPQNRPRDWIIRGNENEILLGWRWERKEIENYLIDPVVVQRSLGKQAPGEGEYQQALESARDEIAVYQAARVALSACRPRFRDLPSSFGKPRGKEKHTFPDELHEEACRAGLETVVAGHQDSQLVTVEQVNEKFEELLPEFQPNGERFQHFLSAFAGKDLLWAMNGWCAGNGFNGAWSFREKILIGISRTDTNVWEWLPEWRALREAVSGL
ncbi:MAG: hypothetical protein J7M32_06650 [Deltaproteobacteria bacterium]|nr:hypothetical protein [Deltaproteobacteria bacterium]